MKSIWIEISDTKELERTTAHHKEHPYLKFSYVTTDGTDNPLSNIIIYNKKGQKTNIELEGIGYYSGPYFKPSEFEFDSICIKYNGKYGLLGADGLLTEIEYENRILFENHRQCKIKDLAPVIKENKIAIINRKGEIVSKFYDTINSQINVKSMYDLEDDVLSVSIQGKFGLMKSDGTEILPCEYDEPIKGFKTIENPYFPVSPLRHIKKNGKYGLATIFGELIPCAFDKPLSDILSNYPINIRIV